MSAMRTTMHNGRGSGAKAYGTKHNDRNFDTAVADNIDAERSHLNEYWQYYEEEELSFEVSELRYYAENFGEQLNRINERYRKNGHPENCKEMAEWKQAKRNAPEECIFQIGNIDAHVDPQTLTACWKDYLEKMNSWSQANGTPFVFLSWAMHADEAVPHIQARRVWQYKAEDGCLMVGQEKALAAAGVQLPNLEKTPGRHNNRKMTFDTIARSVWLETLHEHGLDVERNPVPDGKHNRSKEQMIRDKYEGMILEADTAERAAEAARQEAEAEAARAEAAQEAARAAQEAQKKIEEEIARMRESQNAASQAAQVAAQRTSQKPRKTLTGQIKLSQEEYDTLVQSATTQAVQVASERARADTYRSQMEKAMAETKQAQEALRKARDPLDQLIREATMRCLREENLKLKTENHQLRQALSKLTEFVQEKAPTWFREFIRKAQELLPGRSNREHTLER